MQETLFSINKTIDQDLFPCPTSHRQILLKLLHSVQNNGIKNSITFDNELIKMLLSRINDDHEVFENLHYRLPTEKTYYRSQLEELISIIFQSKPLRTNDKISGTILRKNKGIFHTPYSVATIIAQEGLNPIVNKIYNKISRNKNYSLQKSLYQELLSIKIIDPACGTGIILSAAVERLSTINQKLMPFLAKSDFYKHDKEFTTHIIKNNIFGVDIDPEACSITRAILNAKYSTEVNDLSLNIKCGDSIFPSRLFDKGQFSFSSEFSSVFSSRNGFDVLIMNPPYERLKVDQTEFHELKNGTSIYNAEKTRVASLVRIIKESSQYPLSSQGVLDLYKIFIDKSTQITHNQGTIAFIVPLSLLGDQSCKKIREYLLNYTQINKVYCIPEKARLFHEVSQAFCIISATKNNRFQKAFTAYKDISSISPLTYTEKIEMDARDIKIFSPNTLSIPICNLMGWKILKKIHKFSTIHQLRKIENLRGEIDLTFGSKYITSNPSDMLLIRGNIVSNYTLLPIKNHKLTHINHEALKDKKLISSKLLYINKPRLIGQQISNMGLKSRLKFAFIEKGIVGNSCNFIASKENDTTFLFFLLGLLNSSLLNWRFKLTSTNNHVNNYELDELPIPSINSKKNKFYDEIVKLAIKQCANYSDLRQTEIDNIIFEIYGLLPEEKKYILNCL